MFLCWDVYAKGNTLGDKIFYIYLFMNLIFILFSIYYYFYKSKFKFKNIFINTLKFFGTFIALLFLHYIYRISIISLAYVYSETHELCTSFDVSYFRTFSLIYYIFSVGLFYIMSILFSKKNNINKDKFDKFFKKSLRLFIIIAIVILVIYPIFEY